MFELCPKCQCNDIEIVRTMFLGTLAIPEWGCNWCGHTWPETIYWPEECEEPENDDKDVNRCDDPD